MFRLPTDLILHILSFLPLQDLCLLSQQQSLNFYVNPVLLSRIKQDRWSLILQTPAVYFGLLCNRDMPSLPIATLTCVGYNSLTQLLRFESTDTVEINETQSIKIYCKQWRNLLDEEKLANQMKLVWRLGNHTKQVDKGITVGYNCITSEVETKCKLCLPTNRCNKHAFMSTPTACKKNLVQVYSARVSLDWIMQGFFL